MNFKTPPKMARRLGPLLLIGWLLAFFASAQSPVTITVHSQSDGWAIPNDFAGVGFETWAEGPNRSGVSGHLFSPANTQLVTLFANSGIRNLRLGGCTVEGPAATVPTHADIDSVFGFAKAARIKIIYSLPLLDGDAAEDAATAKYIWTHYRQYLDCFSIGNEPNEPPYRFAPSATMTNYASYLANWKTFANAVTAAVPGAKFTGPDSGGTDWVADFARDERSSGMVVLITQHQYAGGKPFVRGGRKDMSAAEAIDNMLSIGWVTNRYPAFYKKTLAHATAEGLACRMTEANDYLHGVTNASNAFASALWALDYMHWWAAHGCAGINFHNNQHTEWLKTDTIYLDESSGEYRANPKACGIRAFDLGSQGRIEPIVIDNRNGLNLTAYAVGDPTNLLVTIINKEHGPGARDAAVSIELDGFSSGSARIMRLAAANGGAGATNGITLGGARITNDSPWRGQWTELHPASNHSCKITVPATSAAIVQLSP